MNSSQNPSALRSKKIITETLLRLMEQYPYAEITVKHILLESTVSRKTFYRNFSSKDDVLNSYIDAILLSYLDTLKENEEYSFLRILDVIFYFCQENKKTLLLFRDNELLYLLLMKPNKFIPYEHEKIVRYDSELLSELSRIVYYFEKAVVPKKAELIHLPVIAIKNCPLCRNIKSSSLTFILFLYHFRQCSTSER